MKSLGLKLKVCKINEKNLQIDHKDLESKISKKTKAIILIYNFGNLPNLLKIKKISKNLKFQLLRTFLKLYFQNLTRLMLEQ